MLYEVITINCAAYLGIIRHNGISVQEFELTPGQAFYVATYEHNTPCSHYRDDQFNAASAEAAILKSYLPQQLDDDALKIIIRKHIRNNFV